jgi:hemerythrin-like domain-containing protein
MPILPTAAPSFDTPLDMLRACHERIQAQCATLHKLLAHLPQHGADLQAQQAARAVLRYFDTAGPHHHDDEEHDLFPPLRASGNAEVVALTDRLLEQHLAMDAAWQSLRPLLQALAEGNAAALNRDAVEIFTAAYEQHIALENGQLLPLAARLLDTAQLATIGAAMAKRRGIAVSG